MFIGCVEVTLCGRHGLASGDGAVGGTLHWNTKTTLGSYRFSSSILVNGFTFCEGKARSVVSSVHEMVDVFITQLLRCD